MTSASRDAYLRLSAEATRLYRQLARCPAPWIDPQGLAVLTDLPVAHATRLAEQLAGAELLTVVDRGYALPDAQRLHASSTIDTDAPDDELARALSRWLEYLLAAAGAAEQLITPSHRALFPSQNTAHQESDLPFPIEEVAALDWLEAQLPNYMAALRFGFCTGNYQLVCSLAHQLWPLWLRRRHPQQRYEAHLLGLASAAVLKDQRALGEMLTTMAGTVRGLRPHEAHQYNQRAAQYYRDSGDTLGLAQALNALGKDLLAAGALDQADARFREAEALRAEAGFARGVALSRQGRGLVSLARGDAATAAEHLCAAYQGLLGVEDAYDAALTQAHHAEALAALGDLNPALLELESASLALREAGSTYGQAVVLEVRARILSVDGEHGDQVDTSLAQALALFAQTDPPSAERVQQCINARRHASQ
jgi:hypothetical protein